MLRKIWQEIQTIVIALALAVLAWLYAENENVKDRSLQIDIQFVQPAGEILVIDPPRLDRVQIFFKSSTSQYVEMERLAAKPLALEVAEDRATTSQAIDLRSRLSDIKAIADMGIRLTEVRPDRPSLNIEALVTRSIPIRQVTAGDMDFNVTKITPETASVQLPRSLDPLVSDATRLEVRLDETELPQLQQNVPLERDLPLRLPAFLRQATHVKVDPERAKVAFVARKRTRTLKIPLVSVFSFVESSPNYLVTFPRESQSIVDVEVTGPRETIERIEANNSLVWASVRLFPADLDAAAAAPDSRGRKTVEFVPPADVRVTAPVIPPTVTFTVERRPTAPATSP